MYLLGQDSLNMCLLPDIYQYYNVPAIQDAIDQMGSIIHRRLCHRSLECNPPSSVSTRRRIHCRDAGAKQRRGFSDFHTFEYVVTNRSPEVLPDRAM